MERLLLVDGCNLLFQMFFGMPARITAPDGHLIQGTLGFVGALLRMLRMVQPTHAAVIFDGERENARQALDVGYKANREDFSAVPDEENPFTQLPDIFRALSFLGIPFWETESCEADDCIAACATRWRGRELVISSFDSDFFQLIDSNTRVLRYRGEKSVFCDEAWLQEKLGVSPGIYADFKALTGDTADNIPGIPMVGPKTAAALLAQFGSLEGILEGTDAIARPALRASIQAGADRLRLNYQLIRLTGSAVLPMPPEALRFDCPQVTTTQVLQAIGLK